MVTKPNPWFCCNDNVGFLLWLKNIFDRIQGLKRLLSSRFVQKQIYDSKLVEKPKSKEFTHFWDQIHDLSFTPSILQVNDFPAHSAEPKWLIFIVHGYAVEIAQVNLHSKNKYYCELGMLTSHAVYARYL